MPALPNKGICRLRYLWAYQAEWAKIIQIARAGEPGMQLPTSISDRSEQPYISTGHLPDPELVQKLVSESHARFKSDTEGQNSQVYPALAWVPSHLFGVCVVGTSGRVYAAGDVDYEFSIMSVSKPFVFALVCELIGPDAARDKLGASATGLAFNSLAAVERMRRAAQAAATEAAAGAERISERPSAGMRGCVARTPAPVCRRPALRRH